MARGRATLTQKGVDLIHDQVESLFDRVKARFLSPENVKKRGNKTIAVNYRPVLTLPELYNSAATEEYAKPDEGIRDSLVRIAEGYLDAAREKTKARITSHIDQFLREADAKDIETNVETVLGGQLAELFGTVTKDVKQILEGEANHAKNTGLLEGIQKVAAASDEDDPSVFFIVVNDQHLCEECKKLHLLDGGPTPRVWKLSQIGHSYHKRGDENPKIMGCHPTCRCSLVYLAKGYGFKGGKLAYIGRDHDELSAQSG